jgi:2-keto-3-deoxy-L-fuconate dehydrogenase
MAIGRLEGKTALVSAAAQGIGRAIALSFASEGAQVWAIDVNAEKLAEFNGTHGTSSYVLDVTDSRDVTRAASAIGIVDILVNAVGWAHHGSILECSEKDWDRSFSVNVRSMYLMTRAFLPRMIERGNGIIINVGSVVSSLRTVPNRFVYASTKGAVIGFTKAIAVDFAGRGIRCNAVCPGTVATPSLEERIRALPDPHAARAQFVARQPMGRLGKPEEIASLCVYLASDAAAFMTGAVLVIDGGMSL